MNSIIALDARMIRSSGIGTILVNVIPRILRDRPDWRLRLAGDKAVLQTYDWAEQTEIVHFSPPLYSLNEQFDWPAAAMHGSQLLWCPNYNVPLRWRGNLMVTINDLAHIALPDMYKGKLKKLYARGMFEYVRRVSAEIIFISKFTESEFHRLLGETSAKTRIVHCGVAQEWFDIPLGTNPYSGPFFLFVGNVKPHKNLVRLLEAFAKIREDVPHKLLIVGRKEGFITGDHRVLEMENDFGGRVEFTGHLSDTALQQLFAHAQALILPSLYEGFGLPPLEAMAAGCPALVSRAGSMPEVCLDAAVYFDPMDTEDMASALRRVLTDTALRSKMRFKGRARARELTWSASAEGYIAAIENLLVQTKRAT